MITQEELIAAIEEAGGVDPLMADLTSQFLEQNQLGAMSSSRPHRISSPQPVNMATPVPQHMDMGMAMGSMDSAMLQNLTMTVSNLARSTQDVIQFIRQDSSRVNSSIQNLAQLQQQAQNNISSNQMSMQQAQWYAPEMFQNAPSLAYQTNPQAATFRNPMSIGMQRVAQRPSASFFSDLAMSSTAYRPYYEPSFAEDPFNSMVSAGRRMEERYSSFGSGAGEIGSAFAGGIAGDALVKVGATRMATSALTKIGLGSLGGPIGTIAALGDMALDLAGLPSISGTASKIASSAWEATGGQYFTTRDMAKDFTRATQFYTGPGADITGQGMGRGMAARMASGVSKLASKDAFLDREDYFNIFTSSAEEGLLNQAGNEEQMLKTVRTVSKNLRLFMRISGDTDYRNAIRQMGDMYRMGVGVDQLSGAAQNIQNFSKMAGINYDQAQVFGTQGALINQQAGANMGVGFQMGVMNRAIVRQMAQAGDMSTSVLAGMGGEEGAAQALTETMGAFMAGPGRVLGAGLLKMEDGRAVVDQDAMDRLNAGKLSYDQLERRAAAFGRNERGMKDYLTRQPEIMNQLSERGGEAGTMNMMAVAIEKVMKSSPGTTFAEASRILYGERGYLVTKALSPANLRRTADAHSKRLLEQQISQDQITSSKNHLFNYYYKEAKGAVEETLFSPIKGLLSSNESENAYEEAMDIGALRLSPEARLFKGLNKKFVGASTTESMSQDVLNLVQNEERPNVLSTMLFGEDKSMFLGSSKKRVSNIMKSLDKVSASKIKSLMNINPLELRDFSSEFGGRITDDSVEEIRSSFEQKIKAEYPDFDKLTREDQNSLFENYLDSAIVGLGKSGSPEKEQMAQSLSAVKRTIKRGESADRARAIREVREDMLEGFESKFGIDSDKFIGRLKEIETGSSKVLTKFKSMGIIPTKGKNNESLVRDLFRLGSTSTGTVSDARRNISKLIEDLPADKRKQLMQDYDAKLPDDLVSLISAVAVDTSGISEGSIGLLNKLTESSMSSSIGKLGALQELEESTIKSGIGDTAKSPLDPLATKMENLLSSGELKSKVSGASPTSKQDLMASTLLNINSGIVRLVKVAETDKGMFSGWFGGSKSGTTNKENTDTATTTTTSSNNVDPTVARVRMKLRNQGFPV